MTCRQPMVVYKHHVTQVPDDVYRHMVGHLLGVASDGWEVDLRRRSIPGHWHAHARPPAVPPSGGGDERRTGWRFWYLYNDATLVGPGPGSFRWRTAQLKGTCSRGTHPVPAEGCSCGIYFCEDVSTFLEILQVLERKWAAKRRRLSANGWPLVLGEVTVSGPFIPKPDEQSMRGSSASIERLYVEGSGAAWQQRLSDRYGVPVHAGTSTGVQWLRTLDRVLSLRA